ncbi:MULTISPECIES: iron-containing alcohol dehydrogenase [Fervidicoccus]|uniref:iron-containing alcohol dehydrogenase n=1 Tax=Fervidicoccus TaxID=685950 RepID=UPI000AA208CA|nr:iron-containing alcohol dehydrogenase [Fervidicoccus fontis]
MKEDLEDFLKMNLESIFTLTPARPVTYFGVGAIRMISEISKNLKSKGIDRAIIVTDPIVWQSTKVEQYIKPALEENGIEFTIYDKVRPNPTYASCDELANIAREFNAKVFITVGGGSHNDTAKTAAALLKNPGKTAKDLYEKIILINEAIPVVSINTTHGTGSELDKYAVAQSDGGYKPAIAGPGLYPVFAIEDPALTLTLPKRQTLSTALDAFHHSFEAATTKTRNPYSTLLSKTAIRLIAKWLPVAANEPNNIAARYWLMYASAIAGISFDIASLHLTHTLEHPMSALNPKTPHGIGLTAIFPAVLNVTYKIFPELSADLLSSIIPDLKGVPGEAEYAEREIEKWFASIGVPDKLTDLGFTDKDVDRLVENAITSPMTPLMAATSPVEVTKEVVRFIYERSLRPIH